MKNKNIQATLEYLNFLKKQPKGFVYCDESSTKTTPPTQATSKKQSQQQTLSNSDKETQLQAIRKMYCNCDKCPLATLGRSLVVFGEGNSSSTIMFIGEGPGRDEDEQGRPFIGRAGQLLTKIIQAMKLERNDVYISNVVKCRPPNNRVPLPTESDVCKKLILFREIEIIQPKIICTLGSTAAQALLGDDIKITKVRGIFSFYNNIPVMPTYHPAYLLRNPDAKKVVWEDMKKIMAKLNELENPYHH